jgi:hypothetical protein
VFAGENTASLRRRRTTEDSGGAVAVIKPSRDKRFESTATQGATVAGVRRAALTATDAAEVRRVVASAAQGACIAIDDSDCRTEFSFHRVENAVPGFARMKGLCRVQQPVDKRAIAEFEVGDDRWALNELWGALVLAR